MGREQWWSVQTGEEAFGDFAIRDVFVAKCAGQGGFLDVDAVEKRGRGRYQDDRETEPIASMQADGEEYENEPKIGGVADKAIEAGAIELLGIVNGYIGAEGFAQSKDGRPADGERNHQDNETGDFEDMASTEHVGRRDVADPGTRCNGRENDDPKKEKRAAVVRFSCAVPCTRTDANDDFRGDPSPIENVPGEGESHGDSFGLGWGKESSAGWRRSHLLP